MCSQKFVVVLKIWDKISLFKVIYFHVLCFNVLLISECFPFILQTQEFISGWFIVLQNISVTFFLSSNILSFRQYILAPTNIVNPSIFWFEVLFIQNFAFLISYHFILMFVFSILYSKSCKYLQLFSAHSASMTSMQLLPVVIIQYAKYEINHLELD
jgi:hypothetical protein